jgi:hypothetical protein
MMRWNACDARARAGLRNLPPAASVTVQEYKSRFFAANEFAAAKAPSEL